MSDRKKAFWFIALLSVLLLYTDVEFLLVVFLAICGLGAFVCEYLSCQ